MHRKHKNDTVIVLEDAAHIINIIGNDTDVDGNITSISIDTSPEHGSVVIDNTNLNVVYTPGNNFTGSDSFIYQVTDNSGSISNIATVSLTVQPVNDAPIANSDTVQLDEDQSIQINVLANDSDIDGQLDETSVEILTNPLNGSTEVQANGVVIYTPSVNFNGSDQFSYQVNDDQGETGSANVVIQVNSINDLPQAVDQSIATAEDTEVEINLSATDLDGDQVTYRVEISPEFGELTGSNSTFVYQPGSNFNGTDNFTFVASDTLSDSAPATVTITVGSENDAPTADSISVQTAEEVAINIQLSGNDLDGDVLTFILLMDPLNGLLSGQIPNLIYTPNQNFSGADSFTFKVNDGLLDSNTASVTINVLGSNDSPIAESQSLTTIEEQAIAFTLTGNDPDGDNLSFNVLSQPTNGTISGQGVNLIYTPNQNYNGTDNLTFDVHDGVTNSQPAAIDFTITSVNDAPFASDDNVVRDNWLQFDINVLINDSDIDNDELSIIGAKVNSGSVSFNANTLTYTPVNGFIGDAVIEYQITDPHGATDSALVFVNINVTDDDLPILSVPENIEVNADALYTKINLGIATAVDSTGNAIPVSLQGDTTFFKPGINTVFWQATDAQNRSALASQQVKVNPLISIEKDQTVLEGYAVNVSIHLNGVSPQYPLNIPYIIAGSAEPGIDHDLTRGTVTLNSGTDGLITFNILSDDEFEGEETITITLDDENNLGSKFTHHITISEENIVPKVNLMVTQANEQRFVINQEDGLVFVNADITHPDINNQYHYEWSNSEQLLIDTDDLDTRFSFDPSMLPLGIYHIMLKVTDSDSPEFSGESQITIKLEQNAVELTNNDTDNDGIPDNTEGLGDNDNDGIPDYLDNIVECNVIPEEVNTSNNFLVEGDPGVCMRLGDTALIGDSGGTRIMMPSIDDTNSTNIGGIFDFIAYGLPNEGQSYRVVLPQINPIPVNAIYRKQNSSGQWQDFEETDRDQLWSTAGEAGYCPPPGDASWELGLIAGYWCVQLQITDGGPNDADGLVNATIVDPGGVAVVIDNNTQPIALDDTAQTRLNTPLSIDVLLNDSDADSDTLKISSANAMFGQVSIIDNQLMYEPAPSFFGIETIIYGISDGEGGSDSATLLVTVLANSAPITTEDLAETVSGKSVIIDVLANDNDAEEDALIVISATSENGIVTINADNTLTYIPNTDFIGIDIINYRIQDKLGSQASGIVNVTVNSATSSVVVKNSGGGTLYWLMIVSLTLLIYRYRLNVIKADADD